MSQKYDDYVNELKDKYNILDPLGAKSSPMFPKIDEELQRELRDRAIISLVTEVVKNGKELSYGDILLLIDDDISEKEYESNKDKTGYVK